VLKHLFKVPEVTMQTIRYYRDYAERARRLNQGVDRRSIRETLETLAAGFEEIARALETGMLTAAYPENDSGVEPPPAPQGPARFLSPTRH
jgi:hypothetical protein